MSARGAPAAGVAAGASRLTSTWLARRLLSLAVPLRGARLCVACSGGADSMALLVALAPLRRRWGIVLRAAHVDHALQPGSAAWARATRKRAAQLGVDCAVLRRPARVPRGASLEAVARDLRYGALRAQLAPGEWLLLAHHAEDQLETVLLQLLRGAGPAGLAGMPERAGQELRPLLPLGRAALRAFIERAGLGWVEDPSNADPRFDRNYLRNDVLPLLLARWPGATATVARSARLAAEAAGLLAGLADAQLDRARTGRALRAAALNGLREPACRNLLRRWLQWCGLPLPDERRLRELAGPFLRARADAQPCVRWQGAEVRRHGPLLHALPGGVAEAPWPEGGLAWRWRRAPVLVLPGGGSLALRADPQGAIVAAGLPAQLLVRQRAGGERLAGAAGSRRVKELLRVAGIPAWLRGQVPLVYADGRLLAVAGEWLDEGGRDAKAPARGTPAAGVEVKRARRGGRATRWRLVWRPPI